MRRHCSGLILAVATGLSLTASLGAGAEVPRSLDTVDTAVPQEHRRAPDQTFLTFPEWFLVFSPAEYADLVATRTPDEFVFWGHIGQFWQSYARVTDATRARNSPFNGEYHLMIWVIGISTTVEYAIRSAYETVIGRLTALTSDQGNTDEDRLGARYARDYVDFIRIRPWYEFDFIAPLRALWVDVDLVGPNMLRKWERRYVLTSEFLIKAAYGWLLGQATQASAAAPLPLTAVHVTNIRNCATVIATLRTLSSAQDAAVLLLPRYAPFQQPAIELARCGSVFQSIAGNRGDILLSSIAPPVPAGERPQTRLFTQPILTQPAFERTVDVVPIAELSDRLRAYDGSSTRLEHLFDF